MPCPNEAAQEGTLNVQELNLQELLTSVKNKTETKKLELAAKIRDIHIYTHDINHEKHLLRNRKYQV